MDNLIKSVADKAAESILQSRMAKCIPVTPSADDLTKGMEKMYDENAPKRPKGISDEKWEEYKQKIEEQREKAKEETKELANKAEEEAEAAIKDAASRGKQAIDELKGDLLDLGIAAGMLIVATADFMVRIALIPVAIISATPMGPGVSSQLIPALLKQLKAEGDNLSKIYDECDNKISKLGLNDIVDKNSSRISVPIDLGPINSVLSIVKGAQSTAKPLILAVGASVGDIAGSIPDIEPPISFNYSAKDCTNFSYIVPPSIPEEEGDISPENCSKFEAMSDQDSTVSCNNCKHFNKRV